MKKIIVLTLILLLVLALAVPVMAKQPKVYVCFKGDTKYVALPAAENMVRKGGYWGPCVEPPVINLYLPYMVR